MNHKLLSMRIFLKRTKLLSNQPDVKCTTTNRHRPTNQHNQHGDSKTWKHRLHNRALISSLQWRIQDFPRGGGAPTPQVGVRTYFIGRKLHENERILTPGGGRVPGAPLRSATGLNNQSNNRCRIKKKFKSKNSQRKHSAHR